MTAAERALIIAQHDLIALLLEMRGQTGEFLAKQGFASTEAQEASELRLRQDTHRLLNEVDRESPGIFDNTSIA